MPMILIVPATVTVAGSPANGKALADALAVAIGYASPGDEAFTLPASDDGATVTHWAACPPPSAGFEALLTAALAGSLPPADWAAHGLSEVAVAALLAAMQIDAPGTALDTLLHVDINSANQERLETLPGVGADRAAAIVAGRPWASLADTTAISGLGPATVESWAGLAIAGPRPAPASASAHLAAALAARGLSRI